jgi:thermosome
MAGQKLNPPPLLSEGAERTSGRTALRMNIMAASVVAEAVKSTFGPMGMDKMLVDSLGDVLVTNDGATIMREMDIQHPIAKMMIEVARTQEAVAGDGTTTAVMFAGELLKEAGRLLDMGIHPIVVVRGYRMALKECLKILDKIATDMTDDENTLKAIARTTMIGKGVEQAREHLSDIVVKAIGSVTTFDNGKVNIDTDYIKLAKKDGAGIEETEFVNGLILEKEKAHDSMPTRVEKARVALINMPLELKGKEIEAQISISDPHQLRAFINEQKANLKEIVDSIKASGATVLFTEKGIDNFCLSILAQEGILTVRRVGRSDLEKLSKATGARVVTNLEELSQADLGYAGVVEEKNISGTRMIYVRECREPKSVSILIRGGTSHIADEVERVIEDCLGAVPAAILERKILVGGGATEIELAKQLKVSAKSVVREQLVVEAYANALEIVPKALAENAGLHPIDVLVELRSKNTEEGYGVGLDVFSGKIKDMLREGIIEPLRVKKQAITSASEVAVMILRIDDIMAATKLKLPGPGDMAAMTGS